MALAIYRGVVTFRDARGQTGRTTFYGQLEAGTGSLTVLRGLMDTVASSIAACSNAAVVGYQGLLTGGGTGQVVNPDQYGANAAYPNIEDKATLKFLMANNTLSTLSIPAPKGTGGSNIFLADGETVNPLATPIVNLVAALTAVGASAEAASSKNGSDYNILVLGMRTRRRFQRKNTIWTLTPAETGPDE